MNYYTRTKPKSELAMTFALYSRNLLPGDYIAVNPFGGCSIVRDRSLFDGKSRGTHLFSADRLLREFEDSFYSQVSAWENYGHRGF